MKQTAGIVFIKSYNFDEVNHTKLNASTANQFDPLTWLTIMFLMQFIMPNVTEHTKDRLDQTIVINRIFCPKYAKL